MSKPQIIIIGAGGHCNSCIDVIEQEGKFDIAGIVDRVEENVISDVLGYPLIGSDADLPMLRKKYRYAFVGVGQIKSASVRVRLFCNLKELEYCLPVIVSRHAYVSRHAEVREGSIVMHRAVVNANARVGAGCILNSCSLIEHDAVVGNHTHISTGAVVNGAAKIGDCSFIGSGATVIQGVALPDNSFVRAGSLVMSRRDCVIGDSA